MLVINIAKEFTDTPGPRYIANGDFSGEAFREQILIPKYKQAIENNEKLEINLDGGYGYPSSFLEEAFGGLARIYEPQDVLNTLTFISNEEPPLIPAIKRFIEEARDEK